MKSPIFRPAAAADVEDAYRWYETQQIGLGDGFLDGVRAALEAIEAAVPLPASGAGGGGTPPP